MYGLLKPLLFQLPPERAHHLTVSALATTLATPLVGSAFRASYRFEDAALERSLLGLRFPNPVGLAAGFDKDGKYYHDMAALGFGFLELGTVTPRPQAGNPQPRLFRLPQDRALINRMGFNNEGVTALVDRLRRFGRPGRVIIGGNIGKNKDTPNKRATEDYLYCFEQLFQWVDYFVVNVSSPNTPNLRALQDREPLTRLLADLRSSNLRLSQGQAARPDLPNDQIILGQMPWEKPILLKIAPDLTEGQLNDIVEIVRDSGIQGVIATNTTIARQPLTISNQQIEAIGAGGLSGAPVRQRSTEVIRYLHQRSEGAFPIIGVGGIDSPAAALEKLAAGASLVQLYSGMVYAGPGLVKGIKRAVVDKMSKIDA